MSQQTWGNAPGRTGWAAPQGQQPWGLQQPQWGPPQQGYGAPGPSPQGYGAPGQFPQQRPPRRRSPFAALLKVGIAVIAILMIANVVRGLLGGGSAGTETTDPPANSPYKNEGYQAPPADMSPPELPIPQTVGEANDYLLRNPIYAQSVPVPTNCQMGSVDALTASRTQMEKHLNELMGCLMAVWEEPVTAAGYQMPRPPVTVYDRPIKTACGDLDDVNAVYCAADQQVYYALPLMRVFPPEVQRIQYAAETILAHEFGHAVQARTGILISGKALEQRMSDADAIVASRRMETQADCFAAKYVRSVAQSQSLDQAKLAAIDTLVYNLGDDVLSGKPNINGGHGLGKTRQAWFSTGMGSDTLQGCNTFNVPANQVR